VKKTLLSSAFALLLVLLATGAMSSVYTFLPSPENLGESNYIYSSWINSFDNLTNSNGAMTGNNYLGNSFGDLTLSAGFSEGASAVNAIGLGYTSESYVSYSGNALESITSVPEPTTLFLVGMGLIGAGLIYRKKS